MRCNHTEGGGQGNSSIIAQRRAQKLAGEITGLRVDFSVRSRRACVWLCWSRPVHTYPSADLLPLSLLAGFFPARSPSCQIQHALPHCPPRSRGSCLRASSLSSLGFFFFFVFFFFLSTPLFFLIPVFLCSGRSQFSASILGYDTMGNVNFFRWFYSQSKRTFSRSSNADRPRSLEQGPY